ncbi:MAG: hypothetical protein Kow0010_10820 [Dehalococcoidia bacterium]
MAQPLRLNETGLHVRLRYCVPCDYTLRATWVASELLTKHPREIASLQLEPGSNGDFEFSVNDRLLFSKQETGEFPSPDDLEQLLVKATDEAASG